MSQFEYRCLSSIADVDREQWARLFGDAPEGFDYFAACERVPPDAFDYSAIGAFRDGKLAAGAPVFFTHFDPGLVMDGIGRVIYNGLSSIISAMRNVPMVGFGTPHTQDPTIYFDPDLTRQERTSAFEAMLAGLNEFAETKKARVLVVKDAGTDTGTWGGTALATAGYSRITALPVAVLPTPASEDAYFASLSGNMRSNLRRRLKRAKNVHVEIRDTCEDINDEMIKLRKGTMARGSGDFANFAATSDAFYPKVLTDAANSSRLFTYWLDEQLLGFAMVSVSNSQLVQNYNGMRYPEGPDNGIFYLDWISQLRYCIEHGIPEMQTGVTTYLIKARLGCRFHHRYYYIRHRYEAINKIIKSASSDINLGDSDPGLMELGETAPFVDNPYADTSVPGTR